MQNKCSRIILSLAIALSASFLGSVPAAAQPGPQPPSNLVAKDKPWDDGTKVILTWDASPDDGELVKQYRIYQYIDPADRKPDGKYEDGYKKLSKTINAGTTTFTVANLIAGKEYRFRIRSMTTGDTQGASVEFSLPIQTSAPVTPTMQPYDGGRFWLMIITIIFCGSVIYWILHARKGKPIKVRKIAGLEAVDEAVGRATEMGRSCLYVPGIQDINEIQTITSMTILARVSKTAAEYDAKVEVPTSKSLVMATARETVQAAYLSAGRPDAYNQDLIYYVTDEQFGYVAYLQGMMVREKPAACFYMGAFYAESLILAETGNSIGAIQIAGTAMPAQLPFFVAACDYTLIGEEFFAASAYLSGSPEELGSLKGQDVGKIIVVVLLVIGVVLATLASITGNEFLFDCVSFLKNTVLT